MCLFSSQRNIITDNLNYITPHLNVVSRLSFSRENFIILVLLVLTISLNFVQYSCTESTAVCKTCSFSANTLVCHHTITHITFKIMRPRFRAVVLNMERMPYGWAICFLRGEGDLVRMKRSVSTFIFFYQLF